MILPNQSFLRTANVVSVETRDMFANMTFSGLKAKRDSGGSPVQKQSQAAPPSYSRVTSFFC